MNNQYTKVAILLHWLIGISIIALIAVGFVMGEENLIPKEWRGATYGIHKSLGLTVLVLTVLRIIWRIMHKPPELPSSMSVMEVKITKIMHFGFYFLMLALPLTGWLLVSASPRDIPTIWFGMFEWPDLPVAINGDMSEVFSEFHEYLAWIAVIMIALHFGAVLKHHFVIKDDILTRMLPCIKPRNK